MQTANARRSAEVDVIRQADALSQHWQHVLRLQQHLNPPPEPPERRWHAPPTAPTAPSTQVRAAGKPSTCVSDFDDGWAPSAIIGGVARLVDVASAGNGDRMHRLYGAHDPALPPKGLDGDVSRGCRGGWLPAEPALVPGEPEREPGHAVGWRPGSAAWRAHVHAADDRAAARDLMRQEAERAGRFFGRREEEREVADAAKAHAARADAERAAVVGERRARAHANPLYMASTSGAWAGGGQGASVAVGYRPGSAAARRVAGGLFEAPRACPAAVTPSASPSASMPSAMSGHHSWRLEAAEARREAAQQAGAALAVARREGARRREEAAHDARLAAREAAAAQLTQRPEHADYMERVAARKQIHMKLNMALAPYA